MRVLWRVYYEGIRVGAIDCVVGSGMCRLSSYSTCELFYFFRVPSRCVSSIIYCISTVNRQHMQRPDVLVKLGYIWRHVSAVNRPSSGQKGIVYLSQ